MTYADIRAIRQVYPNAIGEQEGYGVWDANGNLLEIDESLVNAAAAELAAESAWEALRAKRDQLLAATDWEIVKHKELGTTIPAALKTYRQQLRDLPANTSDPANPSWPVKP